MNGNGKTAAGEEGRKLWYALRVTYNREMKVKADLDSKGIENFVPMTCRAVERDGRLVKRLVPSVHNLIFVHIEPERMRAYKQTTAMPVRYIMDAERRHPVTVPADQMESFIAVAGTLNEQLIYLTPKPGDFSKGDRRVVVCINGVVAVATTFIHPSLIERLND